MANNMIQNKATALANAPKKTMQDYIKALEPEIKKALPSVITPERFTRMTLSAISTNQTLAICTPKSFLGAMMSAAQLGLEPNTPLGQAYLIPYKNKHKVKDEKGNEKWVEEMEVQFQIGYKGLIDLAYRSGEVELIQAHIVYEKDDFEYEYGLNPKLSHKPSTEADKGNPVAVYAMFKTKAGGFGFEVMSVQDINAYAAKYSQTFNSSYSPWKKNFEEMAKKTVLKKVLKYAPLKSDFVKAVVQDETIKTEVSDDMYSVNNELVYEDVEYTEVSEDGAETEAHTETANN